MKNNLKRILLLLPVISVLLVALAVPAFADGTDGGYVEPVTFDDVLYFTESSGSGNLFVDVTLGVPVSLEIGNTYSFSHYVVLDLSTFSGVSLDLHSEVFVMRMVDSYLDSRVFFCTEFSITNGNYRFSVLGYDGSYGSGPFQSVNSIEILCNKDLLPYLTAFDYTYYTVESTVDGFTSVWTEIMTWITSALNSVMGAFYVDGSFTLLGTLAVMGVSVGICFLLIGLIQRFLHQRG